MAVVVSLPDTTFCLDLSCERLWCGEHEIKLTRTAFAFLRYLVEHPHKLITKDDLLNHVWSGRYVNEELVKQYVRDVRKALGDDPDSPRFIETVRGRGYRYIGAIAVGERVSEPHSPAAAASEANMVLPLPDKPSLAVLPFDNLSGDSSHDFFAAGITEGIITTLSKIPKLFVIARHSTFTYKGKTVSVKQVAEELGVRYVLEGSVQKSGERMRVTAQLIDALGGHHLWAEKYDRPVGDIFELQDDITWRVATELEVQLTEGEQARVWRRQTRNLGAYQCFLRGREFYLQHSKLEMIQAQKLFEQAVALDPQFATGWAHLGWTYAHQARFSWVEDCTAAWARAAELAHKTHALDDTHPRAYCLLGITHLYRGEHQKGIELTERAVVLDPNYADVVGLFALHLVYAGRAEEALAQIRQAMRLNPYYPAWYLFYAGIPHLMLGAYAEALEAFERSIERNPKAVLCWSYLASTDARTGRLEEARSAVAKAREADPTWTVTKFARANPFKDSTVLEPILAGLREAGLAE